MSRTIDERVVSMQFDNKNFESNVQTSLTTLDKLKKALKLDGASKGLQDVGKAAKKCDLAPLGNSAHTVGLKFNALYTMADQAFRNIYNSAERYAKKIVSAFTIDPIKTGFEEYETQLNAVQTILANTQHSGTTLDEVNSALDELNTYADKTIYNFTQMTRNIGTFTAAGVGLEDSVRAIQGIANLAAVSGSNSQQASTAMYQLSQALAAGKVSLMDWNSVVNAGMGGKVFQDALIRTSELLGTGAKDAIETYGTFRESLTQGEWLTTKVLTETLAQLSGAYSEADLIAQGFSESQAKEITKLADTAVNAATKVKTFTQLMDTLKEAAQSGWTQSWEYIVGDFEQAKSMWTKVSDEFGGIIGRRADKRNTLLAGALTSNWDNMVDKINEAGVSTTEFEDKLRETMKKSGYDVDSLLTKFGSFKGAFQSGTVQLDILRNTLKDMVARTESMDVSAITKNLAIGAKGEAVKQLQTFLTEAGYELPKYGIDGIFKWETEKAVKMFQEANGLKVTGFVDEATLNAIKDATKETNKLNEEILDLVDGVKELGGRDLLMKAFSNLYKAISQPIKAISEAWGKTFELKPEHLKAVIAGFEKFTGNLILSEENTEKLRRAFEGLFAVLEIVASFFGHGITFAFKGLNKILEHFDLNLLDLAAAAGDALVNFRDWLFETGTLAKIFDKLTEYIAKGAKIVWNWVKEFWALPEVQAKVEALKNAFTGMFDGIKGSFGGTIDRFKEFINRVKEMDGLSFGEIFKDFKENVFDYFVNVDLAKITDKVKNAFKKFVDFIKTAFEEMGVNVEEGKTKIVNFFKSVKKFLGDNMGSIVAIGGIVILIRTLTKIKDAVETLSRPLDILEDFFDVLGKSAKKVANAIFIKNLATSVLMLAASVAVLASMKQSNVWSAVGAIAALAAIVGILAFAMSKIDTKDMAKMSTSLVSLGGSLLLIALAAKILGSMEPDELTRGGIAIVAFIGAFAGLAAVLKMNSTSFSGDVKSFGKTIMKISTSLLILAVAVKIFASMDKDVLTKGGGIILGFLGIITIMMRSTKGMGPVAHGFGSMMLGISASLILMSVAIKILGKMNTRELVQGGIAVGIFLGIITLMAKYSKLDKDQSMASFGNTMLGVGASLLMMAAAIKILGSMEIGDIVKGGVVIALLTGLLGSLMVMAKDMNRKSAYMVKFGSMMIGFGVAMLLVSGSIALLALVPEEDMKRAATVIAGMGILFAAMLAICKNSTSGLKMGAIIGIAVAIGVLAGSLALLSFIPSKDKLQNATGCLTILLLALSKIMNSASKMSGNKGTIGALAAIAGIALVIGGFAYLITLLTNKIDDPTHALTVAKAFATIVGTLAGACALIAIAGKNVPTSPQGIAAIGALMSIIAIIGTILTYTAIKNLPEIGKKLKLFMEEMEPFFEVAGRVKSTTFNGIKLLAEAMHIMSKASIKFTIAGWFGGSSSGINAFKEFIKEALPIIEDIATELSSSKVMLDSGKINIVLNALKTLTEAAANAPSVYFGVALTKWGAGGGFKYPLLVEFTQFIKNVIPEIKDLAKEITGISNFKADNITTVVEAVATLANAAAAAPSINVTAAGAKMGAFASISIPNMSGFAKFIAKASTAMKDFVVGIEGKTINTEAVTIICENVATLAEAASNVPSTVITGGFGTGKGIWGVGGAISWPAFYAFGDFISTSMTAVTSFAEKIGSGDINLDESKLKTLTEVCNAVKILAEAAGELPSQTEFDAIAAGGKLAKGLGFTGAAAGGYGKASGKVWTDFNAVTEWFNAVIPAVQEHAISDLGSKVTPVNAQSLATICEAVKSLAIGAGAIPTNKDIEAEAAGLGLSWSKTGGLGLKGGGATVDWVETSNLKAAKEWFKEVVPLMQNFTLEIGKSGITSKHAETFASVCEGVQLLGAAAGSVASKKEGDLSGWFAGAGGGAPGWGAIVGGKLSGNFVETPLLEETIKWFEKVIPIMQSAVIDIGESGIKLEHAETFVSVCEGVKILAGAAEAAPKQEEFNKLTTIAGIFEVNESSTVSSQLTEVATWFEGMINPTMDLITALKKEGVGEVDLTNFQTVCDAINTLTASTVHIPTKTEWSVSPFGDDKIADYVSGTDFDGFLNWLVGDGSEGQTTMMTALETMKTELAKIGFDSSYATKLTNLGNGLTELAKAAEAIPDAETYSTLFTNKTTVTEFDAFTAWIGPLGDAIDDFDNGLSSSIDFGKLKVAAEAVETLTKAVNNLFGELEGFLLGNNTDETQMSKWISNFESFINGEVNKYGLVDVLKDFGEIATEIETLPEISTGGKALKDITSAMKTLTEIEYGEINVESFGIAVDGLLEKLNMLTSTEEGGIPDVTDAVTAIESVTDIFSGLVEIPTSGVETLGDAVADLEGITLDTVISNFTVDGVDSLGGSISSVVTALSGITSESCAGVSDFVTALETLAETSISNIVTEFEGGGATIATAVSGMLTTASSSEDVSTAVSGFSSIGSSIAEGVASGISNNSSIVTRAAESMAISAYNAAMAELEINSPSKLFMRLGYGVDEGFAKGIDRMGGLVRKSSENMADTAFTGTQNALSRIARLIDSDIDIQPTIRPVVDLTDVRSGARSINGMFGMSPSIRTMAHLGSIDGSMRMRQNGSNDDVISAINSLGKSLSDMPGGDTINVNGITYDDGSNIVGAVKTLVRAAKVERRK